MDTKFVHSTSRQSAICSDIVFRETATSRLVFRPELVENPAESAASIHGTFLYLRKGRKDEWEPTERIRLSDLRKGEGVQLELHANEVLSLFKEIEELYKFHAREGIPIGETALVRADSIILSFINLPREELRRYLSAHSHLGDELLSNLLGWAVESDDAEALVPRLQALQSSALKMLNAAVGLACLKHALVEYDQNQDSADEEFWQRMLTEHSFVLEQVFSWPATIVKGKAYVGGKSVLDRGGNLVDFLLKNYFTNNAALVEIKTPKTPLLGRRYRDTVINPSDDLIGGVMQVMNYRYNLQREFYSLRHGLTGGLEAFEPKCVVIIGNSSELTGDENKARVLELYRNQLSTVSVITFDELFEKTRRLIEILEQTDIGMQPVETLPF